MAKFIGMSNKRPFSIVRLTATPFAKTSHFGTIKNNFSTAFDHSNARYFTNREAQPSPRKLKMICRLLLTTVIGLSCLLQAANPQFFKPKQPIFGQVTLSQADFAKFAAEYKITDQKLLAQFKTLINQLNNQNISPEAKKQQISLLAKQLLQDAQSKRIWTMVAVASIILVIMVIVFIATLTLGIAPHGKYAYMQQRLDAQKKECEKERVKKELIKKNKEEERVKKELEQQENIRKNKKILHAAEIGEKRRQQENESLLEQIKKTTQIKKPPQKSTVTFEEIGDPNAYNDNNI